ncbi:MAG: DUF695 domain-containing protein [Treponema sp.]|jgi:hypothetical protein|nr:DUF695 domain-containing protein [Treponema sp.]
MKELKVVIPKEEYSIFEFSRENLPAIMVMNNSLSDFKPKDAFPWHLSIIIQFDTLIDNGMPAQSETDLSIPFEENIDVQLKGTDENKPNALFLARKTWNGIRELIYRVHDPEMANNVLQNIIENKTYSKEFEYNMELDKKWELNKWHLEQLKIK